MKLAAAEKVYRELQRYSGSHCTKKSNTGWWIKQFMFPLATAADFKIGLRETDVKKYRNERTVWVPLDRIRTTQRCLSGRRLIYQLRRHPIAKKPVVVALPGGWWLLWDGNHRATAAAMRGALRIKCLEVRKASK